MTVQSMPSTQQASRSGFPVWHCPSQECGQPNDLLRGTCRYCTACRPCEYYDGEAHCGADETRMFICGPRCKPHEPKTLRTSRETSPNRMEQAA